MYTSDDSNPFAKASNNLSALEPGTYEANLADIETRELPAFEHGDPPRVGLFFKFQTDTGEFITRLVNATNNEKGRCVELAKSLSSTPIDAKIIRDPKLLWDYLQSLKGKRYLVQCESSSCGRYNNLLTAMPVPLARSVRSA